jgi:polysaccharide biosynthesis/export protein
VLNRRLQRRVVVASVFIAMLKFNFASDATATDYRLRPGDTIEISVAGVPELKQRLTLDIDGQTTLPLVGVLHGSGLTVAELKEKLLQLLPAKAFRMTGLGMRLDGEEVQRVVEANDIAVNVTEYSPVYVNGDVAKPGEQHFRPELTVRQAVALAGGYDVMRYHFVDPVIESADLQADYQTLWTEQAREQLRLARLNAELGNKTDIAMPTIGQWPISHKLANDLLGNETQQLSLWGADLNKEIDFLNRAVKNATEQLTQLADQREKEKEGVDADSAELQRLTTYKEKGDVTSNRVTDARRAMLLSSTRLLQTEEQIVQITREKEGYLRGLEKLNDKGRMEILSQIQDSEVRLATINAKISSTADKLVYAGTMRSQLSLGKTAGPTVSIIRRSNETPKKIDGTEDTLLEPGDVVEISIIPKATTAENRPLD